MRVAKYRLIRTAATVKISEILARKARICFVLALLGVPAFLVGCVVNSSFIGNSTAQTKRNILRCPLFVSSEILYPAGMPQDLHALPRCPSASKLRTIQEYLQRVQTQVIDRNNARLTELAKYLGKTLSPVPRGRVLLTTTGAPLIHVEANADVVVDLRILQALFLGTLVSGVITNSPAAIAFLSSLSYDFDALSELKNQRSAQGSLAQFFAFKRSVRKTWSYPIALDTGVLLAQLLVTRDLSSTTANKWSDYADGAARNDERFTGALLFLMAHEVGHISLRHFAEVAKLNTQRTQGDAERIELDADCYAAALIADAVAEGKRFGAQERVTLDMRGYELFFLLSAELAGFKEGVTSEKWFYPPVEERLDSTRRTFNDVYPKSMVAHGYELTRTLFGTFWLMNTNTAKGLK